MDSKQLEKRKKVLLDLMNDKIYVPMKIKELAIILQVSKEERPDLELVLNELLAEGKIEISKRGKYKIAKEKTVTGTFVTHPKGFGFIEVEGRDDDIYVSEENIGNAFYGDVVQATLISGTTGKRQEGRITQVISHTVTEVVGIYEQSKHFGFVIPDNQKILQDIFIPQECAKGAVNGHKVIAEITSYGSSKKKPEGRITKIIGHISDPGTDVLSIVYAKDLPFEFPEKVLNQAERVKDEVSEADMQGRLDLRKVPMVTIDGEDAKDLDDAVSLEKDGNIWHLGVHIADVTNYVQENSALDWEAKKRGTSVYLVDRVIPMLPRRLSNGICSLNAGCDRLALSCLMDIDEKGKVIGSQIAETVICVDQRMTYTSVKKILEDQDAEEIEKYQEFVPMFEKMRELSELLRKNRHARGSIDFDFPEAKIILDKKGKPVDIRPYEANTATKIIEDFMLMANETVAEEFFWREIPFLYRTHEAPDEDRIRQLSAFVNSFGYHIHVGNEIRPKEIQKLLEKVEGKPEEDLISRLTLRSMKQARYTTENTGHFGLAAKYYCHFTSPIRRYPDLQIHRIIRDNIRGRLKREGKTEHYREILESVAEQSSICERRAQEAERESDRLKKAEYMSYHLGEEFDGIISGVTAYGLYVELHNTVEGLVHISTLSDDYYTFDEENYELSGELTKKIYHLGQKVRVRVADADALSRTVDFTIVE